MVSSFCQRWSSGHQRYWQRQKISVESGLNPGPNGCLFEAALSGSKSEVTIQEFRDQLANYLETQPALTEELVENVSWLQLYRQEAFLEGGSMLSTTADGLLTLNKWLDEHSDIAEGLANAGKILSAFMWIKNVTPVGWIAGLLVDYGYDKLMENFDFDSKKEQLSSYLLSKDRDLNKEQADILASTAIKFAQTAGRVLTHKLSIKGFNWAKEKFSGENIPVINKVQKENIPRDEITTLRKVGTLLESVDDVMTNPSLLKGQSYEYVRNILGNSKYWVNDVMYKSNRAKGWVLRERNQAGTDFTGRMIQYHPGTPRHFGGEPYWKISSGKGIFRIPIKP